MISQFRSILIFTSILFTQCGVFTDPAPITLYVPDDFTGQIVILYKQADAGQPTFESGRLLLTTPQNGIIKTAYDPGKQVSWNIQCFYLDNNNNKRRIKGYNQGFQDADEDADTTSIHLIADKVGKYGETIFQCLYIAKPPREIPERDKLDSLFRFK